MSLAHRLPTLSAFLLLSSTAVADAEGTASQEAITRKLLWGDTHLHTANSFDAFLNANMTVKPDAAYRYAKGEPVVHAYNRTRVQIQTPLDFLVVSDHAEFFGGIRDIYYDGIQAEDPNLIESLLYWFNENEIRDAIDSGTGPEYFAHLLPVSEDPREVIKNWTERPETPGAEISFRNAWQELTEAAENHNAPGIFTTFMGWEWSSTPGGANLHRIIVSDADKQTATSFFPFSSLDSPYPEDLWQWLAKKEAETGVRFLSIPHNSNVSKGIMFDVTTARGNPIDTDYAKLRTRWEPVVEMTQIKGDSETHEAFSPEDEFARFEPFPFYLQNGTEPYVPRKGDYVRAALRTGLELEQQVGTNPFQLGMIGSTDSHTGLSTAEEPNFWGKFSRDSVPENKSDSALADGPSGWTMSASGLAAVWAGENTRDSIMDAFDRREVYATTGPRIQVRLFGGWQLTESDLADLTANGYAKGVPMGGSLGSNEGPEGGPAFLIQAMRDPMTANLDRIQIIKGWVDKTGSSHESVFNIAWAGDRTLDANGKLAAISDTVDRRTGSVSDHVGEAVLITFWRDPVFDPSSSCFYYVRVLQIPTARHSLLDRIALGLENAGDYPDVIQERAYTSPIWYSKD